MKVDRAHARLGGEVGDTVTDADVALVLKLFLRLGEDAVRSQILELERSVPDLVDVRQQGLVLVVEQLHGALLHRAGECERAV